VMGAAFLVTICTLGLRNRYFPKTLRFAVLGILATAILITKSRSGLFCLVIPLMIMSIFGKHRRYALLFLVAALILGIIAPMLFSGISKRMSEEGSFIDSISSGIALHHHDAIALWKNITLNRLVFGLPKLVDIYFADKSAHSALGIPLLYGIGGLVWTIIFFVIILHKAKTMKNSPEPQIEYLGGAVRLVILACLLYGIVGNIFTDVHINYTLFLMAVFAGRGFELMNNYETEYAGEIPLDMGDDYAFADEIS
jgi:hypothetical protein